ERRKGHELGDGRGTRAPVKPDRAAALGEIEGDEGRRGVPAEEERGVLDEHGASILDLQGLTQWIPRLQDRGYQDSHPRPVHTADSRVATGSHRKLARWHRACWASRDGLAVLDPGQRGLPRGRCRAGGRGPAHPPPPALTA